MNARKTAITIVALNNAVPQNKMLAHRRTLPVATLTFTEAFTADPQEEQIKDLMEIVRSQLSESVDLVHAEVVTKRIVEYDRR